MDADEKDKKEMEKMESTAEEMESEIETREEVRSESERAQEEDLNQGMSTGTHDSIHRGVDWKPEFSVQRKAAAASQSPQEKKGDSDPKP